MHVSRRRNIETRFAEPKRCACANFGAPLAASLRNTETKNCIESGAEVADIGSLSCAAVKGCTSNKRQLHAVDAKGAICVEQPHYYWCMHLARLGHNMCRCRVGHLV